MLNRRWPRLQQLGTAPPDGKQLLDAGIRVSQALLAGKALAQGDCNRADIAAAP